MKLAQAIAVIVMVLGWPFARVVPVYTAWVLFGVPAGMPPVSYMMFVLVACFVGTWCGPMLGRRDPDIADVFVVWRDSYIGLVLMFAGVCVCSVFA